MLLLPHCSVGRWGLRFNWQGDARWPAVAVDPHTMSSFGRVALDSPKLYSALVQRYRATAPSDPGVEAERRLGDEYEPCLLDSTTPAMCLLTYVTREHGWHTANTRKRYVNAVVLVPVDIEKRVYTRIGLLFSESRDDKVSFAAWNMESPHMRRTVHIV